MKFRAHYLLAASLIAVAPVGPLAAYAEDAGPSCSCPVAMTQPATSIGSVSSVSGNVLVSHTASFVPAQKDAPLGIGSRVVTGSKSSASLVVGGGCIVDLGANSSATVVRQDQQLCVRVIGQETTASIKSDSLDVRRAEYGQQGRVLGGGGFGAFMTGVGIGGLALSPLLFIDRDRERCISDC